MFEFFSSTASEKNAKVHGHFTSTDSNRKHVEAVGNELAAFCSPIQFSDIVLVVNNKASCAKKGQHVLNIRIVHDLCTFQTIYLSMNDVCEAINAWVAIEASEDARPTSKPDEQVIELLDVERFFNGQFIHNFVQELERSTDPKKFVKDILGHESFLCHVFVRLTDLYKHLFF